MPDKPEPARFSSLSSEAQQVLEEGKKLWHAYFEYIDTRTVRDELNLTVQMWVGIKFVKHCKPTKKALMEELNKV